MAELAGWLGPGEGGSVDGVMLSQPAPSPDEEGDKAAPTGEAQVSRAQRQGHLYSLRFPSEKMCEDSVPRHSLGVKVSM